MEGFSTCGWTSSISPLGDLLETRILGSISGLRARGPWIRAAAALCWQGSLCPGCWVSGHILALWLVMLSPVPPRGRHQQRRVLSPRSWLVSKGSASSERGGGHKGPALFPQSQMTLKDHPSSWRPAGSAGGFAAARLGFPCLLLLGSTFLSPTLHQVLSPKMLSHKLPASKSLSGSERPVPGSTLEMKTPGLVLAQFNLYKSPDTKFQKVL